MICLENQFVFTMLPLTPLNGIDHQVYQRATTINMQNFEIKM